MSDDIEWLPAALNPVAFRIARADECAYEISRLAGQWSFDGPVDLVQYRRGNHVRTVVESIRPIPPRIPLLFSEAVNHLRAALDNTVWHLVEQAQGPVDSWLATQVAMPIHDRLDKFELWCSARSAKGLTVFAEGTSLNDRLRTLQPFADQDSIIESTSPLFAVHSGTDVENAQPLRLLQAYSNADKHRAVRLAVPRTSSWSQGQSFSGPHRAFAELRAGDVIAEGAWGTPNLSETSTAAMIQRPEPYGATVSPANEIGRLCGYVAYTAVPHLITGAAPSPPLPLCVDLDGPGSTERERLVGGSTEPAVERIRNWMIAMLIAADERPVQFPTLIEEPDDGTRET